MTQQDKTLMSTNTVPDTTDPIPRRTRRQPTLAISAWRGTGGDPDAWTVISTSTSFDGYVVAETTTEHHTPDPRAAVTAHMDHLEVAGVRP